MKRIVKRMFGLLCAIIIMASAVDSSALALTIQDKPGEISSIDVVWQKPTKIINVERKDKQFIVSAKTEKGKVNNLYFSFPKDGGVRFHADKTGYFNPAEVSEIKYSVDGAAIVMQADDTKVKLYRTANPWRFEVYNAKNQMVIYYEADDLLFGYDKKGELQKVKIVSAVKEDEKFFGLGERFSGLIQNNKTVEMWNFDSFGQLRHAYGDHNVGYKNIPILHSNKGYTVFHNNTYYGVVDVADTNEEEYSFEFYGPILDMYVWTESSLENIAHYNELTGSTITIPKEFLTYFPGQSSSIWNSVGSDNVTKQVKSHLNKYDELNTPIKAVYLESLGNIPTAKAVQNYLSSRGVKFFGWMKSTYNTFDSEINEDTISEQLGWTRADQPLVTFDYSKSSAYWVDIDEWYLDYTNPKASQWVSTWLKPYMKKGLSGMMIDFNDVSAENSYYPYIGENGKVMHNLSQLYYTKGTYEAFKKYYGEGNFLTFARAGVAGSQAYGAAFPGDQTSTFLGLQQVVSALLSSSASGINVWGSDIGGLGHPDDVNKNDPELYARWVQFAAFTPIMRSHGQTSWRDPWYYSEDSVDIFQKYYWTRESIVDLINSSIIRASVEDYPLSQSMIVAYPEETKLAENSSQYLFCDSLLVVPVTENGARTAKVQFPKGRWVSIWDGAVYEGDSEQLVNASIDTIPVYLEAGSAVPMTLGKELKIDGINTVGKNTDALVIAPAVEKKENKIYLDKKTTQMYTSDVMEDGTYVVTADKACDKKIVVAMGLAASKVTVDGTALSELTKRPTSSSKETGFYRDVENNTTIIVTNDKWTSLSYSGDIVKYKNLAQDAEVTTTGLNEKWAAGASKIIDGDYTTFLTMTGQEDITVTVDLKDTYKLSKISVNWADAYAKKYKVEVSDSVAEDAVWTAVLNQEDGQGGTDTITLDGTKGYQYIRISNIEHSSKLGSRLVELEVYGDVLETITEEELQESTQQEGTEQEENEEHVMENVQEDVKNNSMKWIAVCGIAVLLLIGSIIAAFFILKKKEDTLEGEVKS